MHIQKYFFFFYIFSFVTIKSQHKRSALKTVKMVLSINIVYNQLLSSTCIEHTHIHKESKTHTP